jgi:tape measure domain-containing protein
VSQDVELSVGLDDELSGPARAEARALQQLDTQFKTIQRSAVAAGAAQAQMAQATRSAANATTAAAQKQLSSTTKAIAAQRKLANATKAANGAAGVRSQGGGIGAGSLFGAAFAADVMGNALQTLTGGGVLSSIGSTIGAGIGGPIGAAIGGAIGGSFDMIIRAAQAAASAVYRFGKSFFEAVAGAAVLRDRAVSAFEALRGKGQGLQGFADVTRVSQEMGASVATTFDGIRALMAAGFKTGDAERWFKRMQDLSAIGINEQTQGRVVLAMSQIKGAGVLQGDELRQLQETGLNIELIWQSIAKQLGTTTNKAMKLKEQGKISADVALKAIEEAVQKMTGGGAAGEARKGYLDKTFGGSLARLKSGGEQWLMQVAEKAAPSFQRLTATVKTMAAYLKSKEGAAWVKQAAVWIDAIVAGLELAGGLVVAFAQGMGLIGTDATKGLAESLREIGKNKDVFEAMRAAGAATAMAINGIVLQVRLLIDALNALWPLLSGLSGLSGIQAVYQLASGDRAGGGSGKGKDSGGIIGWLPGGGEALRTPELNGVKLPVASPFMGGFSALAGSAAPFAGALTSTPALAGLPQDPVRALRAPQPQDFTARGSQTTNHNQTNSFAISVQGGEDGGLAAKIASEVKRQLSLVGSQLGV